MTALRHWAIAHAERIGDALVLIAASAVILGLLAWAAFDAGVRWAG